MSDNLKSNIKFKRNYNTMIVYSNQTEVQPNNLFNNIKLPKLLFSHNVTKELEKNKIIYDKNIYKLKNSSDVYSSKH